MSELEPVTPITVEPSPAILLAEDDPVTRMLMTRFLKKAGYEVDAVSNGSEALDKMTARYYPILVTDWEMPEMDGASLCKAVRNLQLDGYVYALLLTARDSKDNVIAGLEAGADDYLIKPVHEAELIARLNAGRRILNLEHSLRVANQRNRILSITDALTGAYNRRYLMEQLPRELERCRRYAYPLSVLMCDIDHFKAINDKHGHLTGDYVLREMSRRLLGRVRREELLARYGGEEFAAVLPETDITGARTFGEQVRRLIGDQPFEYEGDTFPVTVSVGVACVEGEDVDVSSFIKIADDNLYRAKREGRNRVIG